MEPQQSRGSPQLGELPRERRCTRAGDPRRHLPTCFCQLPECQAGEGRGSKGDAASPDVGAITLEDVERESTRPMGIGLCEAESELGKVDLGVSGSFPRLQMRTQLVATEAACSASGRHHMLTAPEGTDFTWKVPNESVSAVTAPLAWRSSKAAGCAGTI